MKTFMNIARELALGFGIALLIPFIAHYTALVIHPRPAFPSVAINYTSVEEQKNNPEVILFKEQRAKSDTVYLYVTFSICIITLILGTFISSAAIGMGLILGGLICLVQGFCMYLGSLSDGFKLGYFTIILLLLLFLSYRLSKKSGA